MCKTILTLNLLNYSVCRSVQIELTSCLHYYNNFTHIRDIVKINFRLNTSLLLMFLETFYETHNCILLLHHVRAVCSYGCSIVKMFLNGLINFWGCYFGKV